LVIEPVTDHFWPRTVAPSGSNEIQGHAIVALQWLLLTRSFGLPGGPSRPHRFDEILYLVENASDLTLAWRRRSRRA
jgi:hypothetical protein